VLTESDSTLSHHPLSPQLEMAAHTWIAGHLQQ